MTRNIDKMTIDYKAKFETKDLPRYKFYKDDFDKIIELTQREESPTCWELIGHALEVGFMIGYHARQLDEKDERQIRKEKKGA